MSYFRWSCHTFASHLVQNGKDLCTVQDFLGHTTIQMTRRYSHVGPSQRKDAVASLPTNTSLANATAMGTRWTRNATQTPSRHQLSSQQRLASPLELQKNVSLVGDVSHGSP